MRYSVHQHSRRGGRRINQDRMGYCFTRDALLMILADGLGGHLLGEVAAALAMQILAREFQARARPTVADPAAFLHDAILLAHGAMHDYARAERLPEVPHTTAVCCLIQHGAIHWAHAGDSRFYLLREGRLMLRTRDHSKIENLLQQERLLPSEAARHPERHLVTSCLGMSMPPRIEIGGPVPLRPGDTAMLCSDGLWGSLDEATLVDTLSRLPVDQAISALIEDALRHAGAAADNTTAIAARWHGDGPAT